MKPQDAQRYLITFQGKYFDGMYWTPVKSCARRYSEAEIWPIHDKMFLDGIETTMIREEESIPREELSWV